MAVSMVAERLRKEAGRCGSELAYRCVADIVEGGRADCMENGPTCDTCVPAALLSLASDIEDEVEDAARQAAFRAIMSDGAGACRPTAGDVA